MRNLMQNLTLFLLVVFTMMVLTLPVAAQTVSSATEGEAILRISLWQAVTGVVAAALAGGSLSIAGMGVIISRIKDDTSTIAAIEHAAKNVPPETVDTILNLTQLLASASNLVEEVFDGVPITEKKPDGGDTATVVAD